VCCLSCFAPFCRMISGAACLRAAMCDEPACPSIGLANSLFSSFARS
jgi:hypothetical protein